MNDISASAMTGEKDEPAATETKMTAEPRPERRRKVRRKSNGVHRHSRRHYTRTIYILAASLAVLFLSLLIVLIRLSMYAKEVHDLTVLQHKQEQELETLRPKVASLEAEIAELVKGRLPGLKPLEFDKVIPIDKQYVRNIIFTLIGTEEDRSYEYKLTLKNNNLTAVHPIVRVIFFDHLGIQMGHSTIGVDEDNVPTLDVLERGEVRSYTKVVSLPDGRQPRYFKIEVDLPEYQKPKE